MYEFYLEDLAQRRGYPHFTSVKSLLRTITKYIRTASTPRLNEPLGWLSSHGTEIGVQGNTLKACIERQNSFRVESANSGIVGNGKPDVIAVFPDGRTVIYDAKTGYQSPAHVLQVQL